MHVEQGERLGYIRGFDGLRAISVVAVLLYHAGFPVQGGFLGVETFFVLSGFLITALLLTEWRHQGRISLTGFWLRRARRLLPALFFVLAGTLLFAILRLPAEAPDVAQDSLAALLYVMNWHLIWSGQSYFDPLLRPPLLQHLWSLAVEEQFYLCWPLLFAAGMRLLGGRRMVLITLLAAAGSMALMAILYRPGADPSRIYYGTDTRAAGVLLGAALAFIWMPGEQRTGSRRSSMLLDGAGMLALCVLLACFFVLPAHHPLLYRGGFALVDIATLAMLAALSHPGTRILSGLLEWAPLRVIGLRSYGIYLWHWPIFMVTRPTLDLPLDGLPLLALRLVLLGVLVEVSYRYVETPVRRGALSHAWRRLAVAGAPWVRALREEPGGTARRRMLLLLSGSFVVVIVAVSAMDDVSRATAPASTIVPAVERTSVAEGAPAASPVPGETAVDVPTVLPTVLPPTGEAVPLQAEPPQDEGVTAEAGLPVPQPAEPGATQASSLPPLDPALVARLQQVLDSTVAGGYIPGAVLSVGVPGYAPWSGAGGLADRGRNLPMEPDTLVHIASITKMFTAVVVLQLVEEGRVDLNAPIETYLPGLISAGQSTTVRHLLSHTTGIYDYQEDTRFFADGYENPESRFEPAELVARADQEALAFRPGTPGAWRYSSTNYVILGMLVEQVTGRTLAQEMRQRIFSPLQLRHTFFAPQEPVEGLLAQGYILGSDRVELSMSFVFATGNLISTADDLREFGDGLFGGRLLQPATLELMTTLLDTAGAFRMPELEYGLGVMGAEMSVGPRPDGAERPDEVRTVLGHIGGIGGFRSAMWWAPESGITIALSLNQTDVDPNVLALETFEAILTWQGR